MKTKLCVRHYGSVFASGLLMLGGTACQQRENPESSGSKGAAETKADTLVTPEVVRVGKDFHVLDALVREHRRLKECPRTEDDRKKFALIVAQITRQVNQMKSTQPGMNEEERHILAEGLVLVESVNPD